MPQMKKTRPEARSADDPTTVLQRLVAYGYLVRLNRPIGILLLLWPALWALWIAGEGKPRWSVVLIFILGVALMRSAGCAINDFADRKIDGKVERTRGRPLATGLVSPLEAVGVFVAISLMAFALVLFLNRETVLMSFVAVTLAARLSVHEKVYASAAAGSGHGLWLGSPHGLHRADRDCDDGRLASLHCHCYLGADI